MEDILHTVYLKHDTSFKSLTKRALAQVILKIVFQNGDKGVLAQSIRAKLLEITGVKFETNDIDEALNHLRVFENKLNARAGRFYIKETYKPVIKKAVEDSKDLHESVLDHWFGKSKTYTLNDGKQSVRKWFEAVLIEFFKEYSYDWMNDLKSRKPSGKRRSPNLETIIDLSFLDGGIDPEDLAWVKNQFISFVESERKDDNDLLWIYGTSKFSSTLLTVRNFADDFSIDVFKDATFILDTNILMVLELEGFDKSYAIQEIAQSFKNLGIETKYFYVSKQEYQRAILPKRDAILATLDKFDFNVIEDVDCPFMKTALKRGCRSYEDFERFFETLLAVPKTFGDSFPLELLDYSELNQAIVQGEGNETIKEKIDKIYQNRTNNHKRERPKQHDAGIIVGTQFLNKTKKTLILTRDSILREYAFENVLRDQQPIAIGFDSLIQMLAINSGGTDRASTNFAPLFSKLVRESLMPEKDTFVIEDLSFILNTRIQITELPKEKIKQIAFRVSKLRMKGASDDDIVLEIQREFQSGIYHATNSVNSLTSEKTALELENDRVNSINETLRRQLAESTFSNDLNGLKNIIFYNRVKLAGMFIIATILIFYAVKFTPVENKYYQLLVALSSGLGLTYLTNALGFKGRLWLSKTDKALLKTNPSKLLS